MVEEPDTYIILNHKVNLEGKYVDDENNSG